MDFEEKLYKIIRNKGRVKRLIFINKHGPISEMKPYPKSVYEETFEDITQYTIKGFNKRMNCGGYALEIDGCFFPNGDSLSGYVSAILDKYKFVRLLGDQPLEDDEYLVFYRFYDYVENKGKNNGHHFIKVNDDGLVVEKCGSESVRIFEGWNERFEDSPEVAFAVKKDHDNEIDNELDFWFNWITIDRGLDFEGSVLQSILKRSNQFEYHCHEYSLKKSAEDELYVVNNDGQIVADVLVEGEDIAVGIREGKEEYVENFSGPVKPVIENGRLVNFNEFKKARENDREL
ncbi:MAG: hypothetical protein IKF17_00495 [Clostridia bacterium]|nr:hypothetical protein [Clostridia bacterium]